jgi:hypothetical protein
MAQCASNFYLMVIFARLFIAILLCLFMPRGCSHPDSNGFLRPSRERSGTPTQTLAVYEPWFGHPKHISVGYSSHDPKVVRRQIQQAKAFGISGFVVDWYGDREPFIDASYSLMQQTAAAEHFHIAMMYDETHEEDGATDVAIADFKMFHDAYLSPSAPGREAYLISEGRPVIFIFPKGGNTDWNRVRADVDKWSTPPLLIFEDGPGQFPNAFDGYYAWINPGKDGWKADGSSWGEQYLADFYERMKSRYPDKIAAGGIWSSFDDTKASWGLNRHISARCGQTFNDTLNLAKKYYPADDPIPFLLIETWNDYEEGSAIERGIPNCQSRASSD